MAHPYRVLEIGQAEVNVAQTYTLTLLPGKHGYSDAQIDDYGGLRRRSYLWRPGTHLRLIARFSHNRHQLVGTAGFGFWNAPFGDPSVRWPALPKALWFFFASPPGDLPLVVSGHGRGWFASTIDASRLRALAITPTIPLVLLANQIPWIRKRVWPFVRRQYGISFLQIPTDIRKRQTYEILWLPDACHFKINGQAIFSTECSPQGPLGFVGWMDNQFLIATSRGKVGWGTIAVPEAQWLEISELSIETLAGD